MSIKLSVWKTIQIGGITPQNLFNAIVETDPTSRKQGPKGEVGPFARGIIFEPGFPICKKREEVNLALVSSLDLGFTEMPSTDEFITEAFFMQWSKTHLTGCAIRLCPAEVGPQLRRQYCDQPLGEVLAIAMKRIRCIASVGHDDPRDIVFLVKRDHHLGRRWLMTRATFPKDKWVLKSLIVVQLVDLNRP